MYAIRSYYESEADIIAKMKQAITVMKDNIKTGTDSTQPSLGGLIGANAKAMYAYHQSGKSLSGNLQSKAISYALAVTEESARMRNNFV